jgi:hypothetical protein
MIGYRRPKHTRRVLAAVRRARPRRLFVALDGPASPEEEPLCAAVAAAFDEVDWPCDVVVLRRDHNLGCGPAVTGALDWFFGHCDAGIILEDDVLPTPSFFPYCAELLDRYRDCEDVWMVSGHNRLGTWRDSGTSYVWAATDKGIWGWATWRRAWVRAGDAAAVWADSDARERVRRAYGRLRWRAHAGNFEGAVTGVEDKWDVSWCYVRVAGGGLAAVPAVNLTSNIGFGPGAAHFTDPSHPDAEQPVADLDFPLVHPERVALDQAYERALYRRTKWPLRRRVAVKVQLLAPSRWRTSEAASR